jgi:hypothetical protein
MDHLITTASRMTHLKIVLVALVAAIIVVLVGITGHVRGGVQLTSRAPVSGVVKAGDPVTLTRQGASIVR